MTSATQARGTISLSPASGTASYTARRGRSDMDLSATALRRLTSGSDGVEQLAFLVRFAEVVVDPELDGAGSMLLADPRRDHHDRNMLERGSLRT